MNRNIESLNKRNRKKIEESYTRQDEVLELLEAKINDDTPFEFAEPRHLYSRDDTDIHPSRCQQALRKLDERGFADRVEKGKYTLTQKGEQRLEEIRQRDLDKTFEDDADIDDLNAEK